MCVCVRGQSRGEVGSCARKSKSKTQLSYQAGGSVSAAVNVNAPPLDPAKASVDTGQ